MHNVASFSSNVIRLQSPIQSSHRICKAILYILMSNPSFIHMVELYKLANSCQCAWGWWSIFFLIYVHFWIKIPCWSLSAGLFTSYYIFTSAVFFANNVFWMVKSTFQTHTPTQKCEDIYAWWRSHTCVQTHRYRHTHTLKYTHTHLNITDSKHLLKRAPELWV